MAKKAKPKVQAKEPRPAVNPSAATAEQMAWLRANSRFVRTSHHRGKTHTRGTLLPDGVFRAGEPVFDGNGAFGVGIPFQAKRRR